LECHAAWDGNWTSDCYICFAWLETGQTPLIVAVNYAPNQSQCYLQMPVDQLKDEVIRFCDLMRSQVYDRDGAAVRSRGLYLDLPPWGYHVFEMTGEAPSRASK